MTARGPRIVIFSRHYAEYCFRYANALAKDADVLLILDSTNAVAQWDVTALPKRERLDVVYANFRMRQSGLIRLMKATRLMLRFKADFIHFQEIPDVITPLQIAFFNLFTRTVLTVHDPLAHSGRDSNLLSIVYLLRDFGRRRAGRIVVHGQFCRDALANSYPDLASRTVSAPHGVLMVPNSGFGKPDPASILFFGRMEKYKGLDVVYEAVKILIGRGVRHRITIAGRGSAMDELRDALAALPTVTVIARFVDPRETSRLFQSAAVVVLPYKDATQSGVLGAAFGNHRPVVASRVGGLPDAVTDGINGLLIEPGDPQALADALQRVVQDDALRERLSAGAEASAANELNWDNIASLAIRELSPGNFSTGARS
jgi:glycosyltransferase involved in cell wall biosynthesis